MVNSGRTQLTKAPNEIWIDIVISVTYFPDLAPDQVKSLVSEFRKLGLQTLVWHCWAWGRVLG